MDYIDLAGNKIQVVIVDFSEDFKYLKSEKKLYTVVYQKLSIFKEMKEWECLFEITLKCFLQYFIVHYYQIFSDLKCIVLIS